MLKYLTKSILLILFLQHSSHLLAFDEGDWIVRVGPALIEPNDSSDDVEGILNTGVRVDNQVTLGFTIGYMFSSNFAIELLGVTPANHDLNGEGNIAALGKIGDVDVFPPTLSIQYHYKNLDNVKPYIGIGLNYTRFLNEDVSLSLENALGGDTDLDIDDSWGLAAHIGVDVSLNKNWVLNAAAWYVDIDADATLETGLIERDVDIDIDPFVFLISIGRTF